MPHTPYSPSSLKPLLIGVVNMQFTPYTETGDLDLAAAREHTHFMIENGIVTGRGVQVIGAQAGDGHYLSDREYGQLIDLVVKETAGRVPLGVGCMRATTHGVLELARHAQAAGADFVLVMPPYQRPNLPCPLDMVEEHFEAVARAVDIAIMLHNAPTTTGQSFSTAALTRLGEIESIVAYKEDRQDFGSLREMVHRFKDRFTINANSYKALLPLDYQTGLKGYNSFLANVDPAYALRQHDLATRADFAECHDFWAAALDMYNYLLGSKTYNLTELGKEMARLAGRAMGCCERIPHRRPGEAERERLRFFMEHVGMAVAVAA
jgi:4-hydroxy-tetrahydrodipicolinate synthase